MNRYTSGKGFQKVIHKTFLDELHESYQEAYDKTYDQTPHGKIQQAIHRTLPKEIEEYLKNDFRDCSQEVLNDHSSGGYYIDYPKVVPNYFSKTF